MTLGEIRDFVAGMVSRVARFSFVALTSADGQGDAVESHATDPTDPRSQVPVRRMGPFGFRSRPPVGTEAVVLHVNGGVSNGVLVAAESAAYGPSDLAEGESCQYCKVADARVKLDENGGVFIDAASGQDVTVNGGSLKIARDTDAVAIHAALTTWMSNVQTALSGLGAPVASLVGTRIGTVNGSSPRFKG